MRVKMSLSRIHCLAQAAVLEDCSHKSDILGHSLTVQISRETGAAAAQEKARLTKLTRSCQYISQLMSEVHLELEEKQRFSSLQQVLEEEEQRKKAEDMERAVKRALQQRQLAVLRQKEEINRKTEKLQDLYTVYARVNEKKVMHSTDFSRRRKKNLNTELKRIQMRKGVEQAEKEMEEELERCPKQLKDKMRSHEESKKHLQDQHEELQQQLSMWQQRTKQLVQEKEKQLNDVRCKKTLNLDRLREMKRKFKQMEVVVTEDRREQEKLRQQQAKAGAATKLQAWWRGCMVRRGLGSFKKAEEGKKGKKKKEGKKKKK